MENCKLKPENGKMETFADKKQGYAEYKSAKALEKSKANGFSLDEHFELAAKIKPLYETAILVTVHGNLKNPDDPNVFFDKEVCFCCNIKKR